MVNRLSIRLVNFARISDCTLRMLQNFDDEASESFAFVPVDTTTIQTIRAYSRDEDTLSLLVKQNQLDAIISLIYFWNKTLHVPDSCSPYTIRNFSLYTQQWYMSYKYADSLWVGSGHTLLNLLNHIAVLFLYSIFLCVPILICFLCLFGTD
jgi:hypothetical protein